ncbi:MAG: peptidoglycan-binding protein [Alphaproteobacteria bacterium]|nr:peptidoglycan-binding protein [Alphaproteobacteria bacterium]
MFCRPNLIAGVVICGVLTGLAVGVGAQTPGSTEQPSPQEQASAAPTGSLASPLPPLPLGHDGVREVQTQLIALGFDPGPVDGEAGPATLAAAQQYYESRGGSGPVPISAALLAWLQQDGGPRLAPEQVAARVQPRHPARAPAPDPLTSMMQQLGASLRRLFNGGY